MVVAKPVRLLVLMMVQELRQAGPSAIDLPLDLDSHDSVATLLNMLAHRRIPYLLDFATEIDICQQDVGSVAVQKFLGFVVEMIQNPTEGLRRP